MGRAGSRANMFCSAKHLPQAEFISAEDVKSFRAPILIVRLKWDGGPKWTRTTDLTIISRAL